MGRRDRPRASSTTSASRRSRRISIRSGRPTATSSASSALAEAWCRASSRCAGSTLEIVRLPGRTPVLFFEMPRRPAIATVLLYGHLDKQPEMTGWREGLRAVGAGDRGRQALRPRRRRRRLRGVRVARGDPRAAGARHRARALRRHDRDAARKAAATTCPRISRRSRRASARSTSSSGSTPAAATTSSCG